MNLQEEDLERLNPEDRALLEQFVSTEEAILKAASHGRIDTYKPQDHQLPFHQSHAHNRWMICANRVGKSWALKQECRWFALGDHPYRDVEPRGEIWCCCPTFEKSRMFQQPLIESAIGSGNIKKKYSGSVPRFELHNGVSILFRTYQQRPLHYESSSVRLILFDEEPPWDIFEASWFRRGAGMVLDIVGGATMVQGLTWLYDKVVQGRLPSTQYFRAELDDNKYIPEEEKEMLKKGSTGIMHRIRVKGEILAVGGSMRFEPSVLERWMNKREEPILQASWMNGRWVQDGEGPLTLYELPQEGNEYCLGVDVAEGLNTAHTDVEPEWDQTSIQIFNRCSRRFIGDYTTGSEEPGWIGEEILPTVSDWFNRARANVELNNHGHTVVTMARKKMATRLHSPPTSRAAKGARINREFGSITTERSRRYMVDLLASEIDNSLPERQRELKERHEKGGIEILNPATIRECMTFIRKSSGRVEHQDGAKDDRVFGVGLALVCDRDMPRARIVRRPTEAEAMRAFALKNEFARRGPRNYPHRRAG